VSKDTLYCPFCKKETVQDIDDQGHERDSSYDSRKCTVCGAHWMGLTGKYSLYVNAIYEQREENHGRFQ
jgi:transcriptional regulator NrdR family protein